MTDAAISVCALRKTWRDGRREVEAVAGLDLEVRRGEVFGLLGPNGAGKTTTVEICEGLVPATSGEVEVLGMRWGRNDRAIRARIGVTLQDTKFFDKQTVRELVDLFRSFWDQPRTTDEVIGLVSLEQKQNDRYATLSGGQRQRLAVACALVGRPELVFLDEPTTGLDPQARRQLWDIVRDFKDGGGTVLLTTHYMEEASALCDRVMIVDHGKAIALGTPRELIASLGAAHVVEVRAPGLEPAHFEDVPAVYEVLPNGDALALSVAEVHTAMPAILAAVAASGAELEDLTLRGTTLEDVFVHLTGRHLRDGDA